MQLLNSLYSQGFGTFNQSDVNYIFDAEFAALMLSANEANYEQLLSLESFAIKDLYTLQKQQFSVIKSIEAGFLDLEQIGFYLEQLAILKPAITKDDLSKIAINKSANLNTSKLDEIDDLKEAVLNILPDDLKAHCAQRINQIRSLCYRFAFAGCFNAGKSSLINALLKTNLLSASNAPETAAISIIKNGSNEALIKFYSKSEYENILQQANLGATLPEFIELKDEKVALEKLAEFNSSASSKSALVKKIFINLASNLLANNAQLIDTPGLDDVIISREQASLKYLSSVDEVFYLMSAQQALSQKDCDFLCNFFEQNPHINITLVISKSDLVPASELNGLIDYVKERFNNELQERALAKDFKIFCLNHHDEKALEILRGYILNSSSNSANSVASKIIDQLISALNIFINDLEQAQINANLAHSKSEQEIKRINEQNEQFKEQLNKLKSQANFKAINPPSEYERQLFAKKLSARLSSDYAYDKGFKGANLVAKRLYEDFLSSLSAINYAHYKTLLNDLNELVNKLNQISPTKLKLYELDLEKSPLPNIEHFMQAANKFGALNMQDEQIMKQKLSAILLNLDLSNLTHKQTANKLEAAYEDFKLKLIELEPKNLELDKLDENQSLIRAKELLERLKEQR